jgi:uncharacterized membrane protein YdjX (TVP38/TMEM64 family)
LNNQVQIAAMNWWQPVLDLMHEHPQWALLISIVINTIVAIAGLVPSVFVTAANIYFFGFTNGVLVSIAGESVGASVSFILYRYFFRHKMQHLLARYPQAQKLANSSQKQSALLVIGLRLMPFVPSGIITFAAAIGSMHLLNFVVSSTIGKIPALLVEAALVQGFLEASWPLQITMVALGGVFLFFFLKKNR